MLKRDTFCIRKFKELFPLFFQSLKTETDQLFKTISSFEKEIKEANERNEKAECDIRDLSKKITT